MFLIELVYHRYQLGHLDAALLLSEMLSRSTLHAIQQRILMYERIFTVSCLQTVKLEQVKVMLCSVSLYLYNVYLYNYLFKSQQR